MKFDLQNKTALVTGASQGIGREIALQLASEGVKVAITSNNDNKLAAVVDEITSRGGIALAVAGDAQSELDLIHVADTALKHFGRIDILVNNVGVLGRIGNFENMPTEEWVDLFRTNIMSGVILTKQLLPKMKEQHWGRILFLSSERAIEPKTSVAAYAVTKGGLLTLAKSLANELGEFGITVNCISPGVILTPSWNEGAANAKLDVSSFAELHSDHVLSSNKYGMPEDVAALVCFLCSDLARWMTGGNIRVDGGSVKNIQI